MKAERFTRRALSSGGAAAVSEGWPETLILCCCQSFILVPTLIVARQRSSRFRHYGSGRESRSRVDQALFRRIWVKLNHTAETRK